MKYTPRFLGCILLFCAALAWSQEDQDWMLVCMTRYTVVEVKLSSMKRISKNVVQVWLRELPKADSLLQARQFRGYDNWAYSQTLFQVNLNSEKCRSISYIDYSDKGETISSSSDEGKWEPIIPGTVAEGIFSYLRKRR